MKIPCAIYRGGTSKPIFFLESDLPQDLSFSDGKVQLKDQPQMALPIGEVVRRKLGTNGVLKGNASYTYDIGKELDLETGHSDHASSIGLAISDSCSRAWIAARRTALPM